MINTTMGELIVALTEAALDDCDEEREAYLLVSLALEDIFGTKSFLRGPETCAA